MAAIESEFDLVIESKFDSYPQLSTVIHSYGQVFHRQENIS